METKIEIGQTLATASAALDALTPGTPSTRAALAALGRCADVRKILIRGRAADGRRVTLWASRSGNWILHASTRPTAEGWAATLFG